MHISVIEARDLSEAWFLCLRKTLTEGYEYEITWKKFELPDINKIQGSGEEGAEDSADEQSKDKLVYEQMKENIENMIWQVQVRTINKETGFDYTLSTWLTNYEHKIKIGI